MPGMKVAKILVPAAVMVWAFWVGRAIPVSSQHEILDPLRAIASIVFGVVGAWIALVYPRALEELLTKNEPTNAQEENLSRLLRPLYYSTVVLALALAFDFVSPVIRHFGFAAGHTALLRRLSFCLIAGLTLLQFWALALTLGPADAIREELKRLRQRNEFIRKLLSRARKGEDPAAAPSPDSALRARGLDGPENQPQEEKPG